MEEPVVAKSHASTGKLSILLIGKIIDKIMVCMSTVRNFFGLVFKRKKMKPPYLLVP